MGWPGDFLAQRHVSKKFLDNGKGGMKMRVSYVVADGKGTKPINQAVDLPCPINSGVVRLDDVTLLKPVSAELLCTLASDKLWSELRLLALDWSRLSELDKRLARFWLTDCAQQDAKCDWESSRTQLGTEMIMRRCFQKYVLSNPKLNGEKREFERVSLPPQDHWFWAYYEHYQIWWRDCVIKSQSFGKVAGAS